jgi:hypothetical protein
MTVLTLRPNGAGATTQLTPTTGNNYACVDEAVADDADYVYCPYTSTQTKKDTYALPNHSSESGTINSVKVYGRMGTSATGNNANLIVRVGSTDYASADIAISSGWALKSNTWTTSPATSAAWTWTEIDSLEAGVQLKSTFYSTYGMCSQLYVEVDYTESAATVVPVFMNQYRQRR